MSIDRKLKLLCTEGDREAVEPVLQALTAKGIRVTESTAPGKSDTVLAVLSERFYSDGEKTDRLLGLIGEGAENVLPLQIDGAAIPDRIKNALYARNIIPAADRAPGQTAERIISALPEGKVRLPVLLGAGGFLLLCVIGILLWNGSRSGEAQIPAEPAATEAVEETIDTYGMTAKQLALVEDVVIIGDQFLLYTNDDFVKAGYWWPDCGAMAYRTSSGDEMIWVSKEDGHVYAMTRYEDLRFLQLMPRLRFVHMANVEADSGALPDLSGATLLEKVEVSDCRIDSLDWLAGSKLRSFVLGGTDVQDYSPLTSCESLSEVNIDLFNCRNALDLSGFAPPALERLHIDNGEQVPSSDLSGLSGCGYLHELRLEDLPQKDLDFLDGLSGMNYLRLFNLKELRDISPVGTLKALQTLEIEYCDRIGDYSPVAGCSALEHVYFQCDGNPNALRDAGFLSGLSRLTDIGLYGCNLRDMDFLEMFEGNARSISLGFAGEIGDYSGLSHIRKYEYLHINPGYRSGDISGILPYLQDAEIRSLMLYDCGNVDLSALPEGIQRLSIRYGDLTDLSGLKPYQLLRLELWGCQYLRSLNGIESIPTVFGAYGQTAIEITGCPRLTDFTALDGAYVSLLKLVGAYAMPDLSRFRTDTLCLERIEELTDLQFLAALGGERCNLELVGLDGLRDLTPLRQLSGEYLWIPPQVAEQAAELVEDGNYERYEIAYPDNSWNPQDDEVELLSLEELETLPRALLKRVGTLGIAGDAVIGEDAWVEEDWENMDKNGNPTPVLVSGETGERPEIRTGPISDLSMLENLKGIWRLRLFAQPLTTLDGVQSFAGLEELTASFCWDLTDAASVYSMQNLRSLDLSYTGLSSIQGIQNIRKLCSLSIENTAVTDLSPLTEAKFDDEGLWLNVSNMEVEDFSPLSAVTRFRALHIWGTDSAAYLSVLRDAEVLELHGEISSNEDLRKLAEDHPELEGLCIQHSDGVTDLTPLGGMENLRYVEVSESMQEAIESISGMDYGFELRIWG